MLASDCSHCHISVGQLLCRMGREARTTLAAEAEEGREDEHTQ